MPLYFYSFVILLTQIKRKVETPFLSRAKVLENDYVEMALFNDFNRVFNIGLKTSLYKT